MPEIITSGKTSASPYVVDSQADSLSYDITPLITVGDEVPLLEEDWGNFTPSSTETLAMAGIPDGLGYVQIDGFNYVFMNHELSAAELDEEGDTDTQTATNSSGDKVINGARVSLWQFDLNWNLLGGKNLIEDVALDGVTYTLNTETGNYEDPDGNVLSFFNHNNFTRFCSGYLAAQGFVDANGEEIPIWFAPQERSDGVGTPVQANGLATPIRGLGTVSKENIISASQYRATNSDYTMLLATEDNENGEVYLYVGRQTPDNPNGFWGTTEEGDNFQLYVLQVVDAEGNVYGYETMAENEELTTQWTPIPDDVAVNPDPSVLSEFVDFGPNTDIERDSITGLFPDTNVLASPDFSSTNFRRLEDMAEDPNNLGTFYFATTGRNAEAPVNSYSQPNPLVDLDDPPQAATTQRDNPLGKLHRITITLDEDGVPLPGTFENLLQGGLGKGVSYDNIVVDSNGNVILQEDETADGDVIFAEENRDGSVLSYNIAANEGVVGNDQVDFLFEINSAAGDTSDISFFEIGGWETSGVIEVEPNALPGQSSYLFDIQASTISSDDSRLRETQTYQDLIAAGSTDEEALAIVKPAAEEVLGGKYERGGQLVLATPTYVNALEIERDPDNQLAGLVYNSKAVSNNQDIKTRLSDDVVDLGTDAGFDNLVGFYEIIDENGSIDTNGDGIADFTPDQDGYAKAAIQNRVNNWELQAGGSENTTAQQFGDVVIAGERLYAPVIVANGGSLGFDGFVAAEDAETDGVFNNAATFTEDVVAYFAFVGANPDGAKHLQARGNKTYGFEDLPSNLGVSDNDFNDAVFQFNFRI